MLETDLSKIIEHIYATVDGHGDWQSALSSLCDSANAFSAAMFTVGSKSSRHGEVNMDTNLMDDYLAYYYAHDLWWHGAEKRGLSKRGSVNTDTTFEPDTKSLLSSEFYNDFLAPQDIRYLLSLSITGRQSSRVSGTFLSLYRRPQDEPYSSDEMALLATLSSHFVGAFRLTDRLGEIESALNATASALDQSADGILIFDQNLRPVFQNDAARVILFRGSDLCLKRGILQSSECVSARSLEVILGQAKTAARTRQMQSFTPIVVPRGHSKPPLLVDIAACSPSYASRGGMEAWHILVTIVDPQKRLPPAAKNVGATLRLSPRESEVAAHLAGGRTIIEIAGQLGITEDSVRKYTKSIYQRTGARTQAELVSIIYRMTP